MISKENIRVQASASDWKDAVRQAGELLISAGSSTQEYTEAMIAAVEELGPYIVILPGLAIAHAASGTGVLKNDCALITLKDGVMFGSPKDPVFIILCLCCTDTKSHQDTLKNIAKQMLNETVLGGIRAAASVDEVLSCLT